MHDVLSDPLRLALFFSVSHTGLPQHFHGCGDYRKHFFLVSETSSGLGRSHRRILRRQRECTTVQPSSWRTLFLSLPFVTFQSSPECNVHLFRISRSKFPSEVRYFSITQCIHFSGRRLGFSHSHSRFKGVISKRLRVTRKRTLCLRSRGACFVKTTSFNTCRKSFLANVQRTGRV